MFLNTPSEKIMSSIPISIELTHPSLQVLATCLERMSLNYQQHLEHENASALLPELGESLRHLASCYTRALCATLDNASKENSDTEAQWSNVFE